MKKEICICDSESCQKECSDEHYIFSVSLISKRGSVYYSGPKTDMPFGDPKQNRLGFKHFCSLDCAVKFYDIRNVRVKTEKEL